MRPLPNLYITHGAYKWIALSLCDGCQTPTGNIKQGIDGNMYGRIDRYLLDIC